MYVSNPVYLDTCILLKVIIVVQSWFICLIGVVYGIVLPMSNINPWKVTYVDPKCPWYYKLVNTHASCNGTICKYNNLGLGSE